MGSGFPLQKPRDFTKRSILTTSALIFSIASNGTLGIVYADFDEGRLPYYSRLDANLKKKFELGKYTRLEVNVSVTNLLNQENIFYFDRVSYTRVDQMPIMPSLGIKFRILVFS